MNKENCKHIKVTDHGVIDCVSGKCIECGQDMHTLQTKLDQKDERIKELEEYVWKVGRTQCWNHQVITCDDDLKLCIICEGRKLVNMYPKGE